MQSGTGSRSYLTPFTVTFVPAIVVRVVRVVRVVSVVSVVS